MRLPAGVDIELSDDDRITEMNPIGVGLPDQRPTQLAARPDCFTLLLDQCMGAVDTVLEMCLRTSYVKIRGRGVAIKEQARSWSEGQAAPNGPDERTSQQLDVPAVLGALGQAGTSGWQDLGKGAPGPRSRRWDTARRSSPNGDHKHGNTHGHQGGDRGAGGLAKLEMENKE